MPTPLDVTGPLRTADLPKSTSLDFTLQVSTEMTERVKSGLGLQDLRKLRLTGRLSPQGRSDWHLRAQLGATAIQDCIATGAPVLTRIDTDLERIYVADWAAHLPTDADAEVPEDDRFDPLGDFIDLEQLVTEAMALALPDFPRSEDADTVDMSVRPPGADPIENESTRPFAALADLKRKLEEDG
ncbi:MAG: DUF177 domain-containing protein [Pseudomonadota bacterium]